MGTLAPPVTLPPQALVAQTLFPQRSLQRVSGHSPSPYGKGTKMVQACILIDNEGAITDLGIKVEKRKKTKAKKKTVAEKKALGEKKQCARHRKSVPIKDDSEEENIDHVPMQLNDSSEYLDEVEDKENWIKLSYHFAEKVPEVKDGLYILTTKMYQSSEFIIRSRLIWHSYLFC
ncbi:uncharacterized protein LOC123516959 [Portunus trituberculatus]|uniref:uncharacterized protein LOC123516959 n=1 Tax=Portunus trituberculatus TaxID=210409 RepID=UPI001E1CF78A|nr:uncharacterized protein LOC123516959 [Portunus trituberculatus]